MNTPTPVVMLRIKNEYPKFNPAMRQIADYLIAGGEQCCYDSISQLAEKSGVSVASVTRFVKALGFHNYKSFQMELARSFSSAEIGSASSDISDNKIVFEYGDASSKDSVDEINRKVFQSSIQMMSDTLSMIDNDMVARVSLLISEARNLLFFGVGRSFIVAESGRTRFYRLGINTFNYRDTHEQAVASTLCDKRDVAIGISNYGRSTSVVNSMLRAKKQGTPTIGITSTAGSPLMEAVDYCFLTAYNPADIHNHARSASYEPACENVTQMVLLDCLYMNVALRRDKQCIDNFYHTVHELEKERL